MLNNKITAIIVTGAATRRTRLPKMRERKRRNKYGLASGIIHQLEQTVLSANDRPLNNRTVHESQCPENNP